jgi:hypothetical protein
MVVINEYETDLQLRREKIITSTKKQFDMFRQKGVSLWEIENINQLSDTVNNYSNPNTATDKYFDQNVYEQNVRKGISVGRDPQQIYSLTGNYLDSDQFKHNNMVPFK